MHMQEYFVYAAVFAVSFIGAAIQAASGFGYGIFVMSVFPFFLAYSDALCASGLISIFTAANIAWKHRESINLKLVIVPVLASWVTSFAGTFFLKSHADDFLKRILGAFLIVLSLYMIYFSKRIKIKAGPVGGAVAGSLAGLLGSVFGMGGPPIVVYMLTVASGTASYIANIQMYFLFSNVYVGIVRFFHGMMNTNVLVYTLVGTLGMLGGAAAGNALFKRLDIAHLRLMVYLFMIVMGLVFLLRG